MTGVRRPHLRRPPSGLGITAKTASMVQSTKHMTRETPHVLPGLTSFPLLSPQDTVADMAKDMRKNKTGAAQASAAELYDFMKKVRP